MKPVVLVVYPDIEVEVNEPKEYDEEDNGSLHSPVVTHMSTVASEENMKWVQPSSARQRASHSAGDIVTSPLLNSLGISFQFLHTPSPKPTDFCRTGRVVSVVVSVS